MAAFTLAGSSFNTNSGTHTVTATPALNDQIVIIVANSGYTGTTAPTDNNSDGLGTYTELENALMNTSQSKAQVFVRDALVGSASSTVFTHAPGTTTGGGLIVLRLSGVTRVGANAKAKSGKQENQASNGTPAPSWTGGGSASGTNPLVGCVFQNNSAVAMTKPSTFDTEQFDAGYSTPGTSFHVVSDNTGNTDSTVTWGSATSGGGSWCSIIVEIDSTSAGTNWNPGTINDSVTMSDAVKFARSMTIADSVAMADAIKFARGLKITDSVTMSDSVIAGFHFSRSVADSVTMADAITKFGRGKNFADSVTMSDAVKFSRSMSLADSVAMADAIKFARQWHISDSVTMADAVKFGRGLKIADAVSLADSLSRTSGIFRVIADSVTLSDLIDARIVILGPGLTCITPGVVASTCITPGALAANCITPDSIITTCITPGGSINLVCIAPDGSITLIRSDILSDHT